MKMENVFFDFVGTYWEDIAEFLKAFIGFIQTIIGKVKGDDTTEPAA